MALSQIKAYASSVPREHVGTVANQLFRRIFRNSKFFTNARTSGYAYLSKNFESQKLLNKNLICDSAMFCFNKNEGVFVCSGCGVLPIENGGIFLILLV
jgi:hypothetical protein